MNAGTRLTSWLIGTAGLLAVSMVAGAAEPERQLVPIRVCGDGRGFVLGQSGEPFVPWGFNYDHDRKGRLLEDYWEAEWPTVVADFREMRDLGANVVRIHLQTGRFLCDPRTPNRKSLDRLVQLVRLAESTGLYLDLTGLACYHKADVPAWYDALSETERWAAQACFWQAVARACLGSPAVFCFDLMNEPVVPGGKRNPNDWLGPPFAGSCFVQFITLDQAGRRRPNIARQWISQMVQAIRVVDRQRLITVGLVDWSLDRPGLTSGFVPAEIASELDFLAVHLYPRSGKLDEALSTLKGFDVGKPVIVEETFPLQCSCAELERFIERSRPPVCGWIGFYWGQTKQECRADGSLGGAIMADWLDLFSRMSRGNR